MLRAKDKNITLSLTSHVTIMLIAAYDLFGSTFLGGDIQWVLGERGFFFFKPNIVSTLAILSHL